MKKTQEEIEQMNAQQLLLYIIERVEEMQEPRKKGKPWNLKGTEICQGPDE